MKLPAAIARSRRRSKRSRSEDLITIVRASNLRGRGGAGFPTGLKWSFLPDSHPGPVYLCVNADESEPGTFCNRVLMEDDPHQVLEGTILSSYATKASTAYIYLRYEYPKSLERLQKAIDECYAAGYLGKNILGSELLAGYLHSPRCGGLYLWGRDRIDRKPGGKAGVASNQAALPCRRRAVPQADRGQQRGDDGLRDCTSSTAATEWFKSIGHSGRIRRIHAIPAATGPSSTR